MEHGLADLPVAPQADALTLAIPEAVNQTHRHWSHWWVVAASALDQRLELARACAALLPMLGNPQICLWEANLVATAVASVESRAETVRSNTT